MNFKLRNKSGITLIALIITIIVMLILVGVVVTVVIQSNLLGTAKTAGDKYKTAYEDESNMSEVTINGEKYASIEDYLEGKVKLPEGAGKRFSETKEYNDGTKTAWIPAGFTVSGIRGETTIDGGLVIYDIPEEDLENAGEDFWTKTTTVGRENYPTVQCDYNQFVWVPVETPYVTKAELNKIMSDSNGSITTEKAALQSLVDSEKYPMAVELANGTDYRGVLYEFSAGTNKVNIKVMDFSTEANYDDGSVTYYREPAKLSSTDSRYVNQTEEPKLDMQTEYNK